LNKPLFLLHPGPDQTLPGHPRLFRLQNGSGWPASILACSPRWTAQNGTACRLQAFPASHLPKQIRKKYLHRNYCLRHCITFLLVEINFFMTSLYLGCTLRLEGVGVSSTDPPSALFMLPADGAGWAKYPLPSRTCHTSDKGGI
jgi:hypothetical protein